MCCVPVHKRVWEKWTRQNAQRTATSAAGECDARDAICCDAVMRFVWLSAQTCYKTNREPLCAVYVYVGSLQ